MQRALKGTSSARLCIRGLQSWWILVSRCRGWDSSVASSMVVAKARAIARAASVATSTERAGAIAVATSTERAGAIAVAVATSTERAGAIAVATAIARAQPAEARAVAGAVATAQAAIAVAAIAVAATAQAAVVVSVVATHGVGCWGCSRVEKERSITWVWRVRPAEGLLYALGVGVTHHTFMPLASFMTDLISLFLLNHRIKPQSNLGSLFCWPVWAPLIQMRSWMKGDTYIACPKLYVHFNLLEPSFMSQMTIPVRPRSYLLLVAISFTDFLNIS